MSLKLFVLDRDKMRLFPNKFRRNGSLIESDGLSYTVWSLVMVRNSVASASGYTRGSEIAVLSLARPAKSDTV